MEKVDSKVPPSFLVREKKEGKYLPYHPSTRPGERKGERRLIIPTSHTTSMEKQLRTFILKKGMRLLITV